MFTTKVFSIGMTIKYWVPYMVISVLFFILAVKEVFSIKTARFLLSLKRKYCLKASVFLNPYSDGLCLFRVGQDIVPLHTPKAPSLIYIKTFLDGMIGGEEVLIEATGRNGLIFSARPVGYIS